MISRREMCNVYGIISEAELRRLLVREIYENANIRSIRVNNNFVSKQFPSIFDFSQYLNSLNFGYSKLQYFSHLVSLGQSVNIKFMVYRWMHSFVDILTFDVSFDISVKLVVSKKPVISPIQKIREKYENYFKPKLVDSYY